MADRKDGGEKLKLELVEEQELTANLDPKLQDVRLMQRHGGSVDPALGLEAGGGEIVVDVIAKLRDPAQDVPGLEVVRRIGEIVTGALKASNIEKVRGNPNVLSLKMAKKLHPDVKFSVPEIRATAAQLSQSLPDSTRPIDGAGVIVGVVDYGCDFVHRNFRRADDTTRLLYLWDQASPRGAMSPAGFGYGREFTAADINRALKAEDPYLFLAYDPGESSHGTHVMDIAAGNGRATGDPGVAPNADLIFVQVASGDYEDEESFGNSRRLLEAVDYIFSKAGELGRPAVVNLSLGTHGGPHDGTTLVEQGFDTALQTPGRAVVISAGNSRERGSHASGSVAPGQPRTLSWEISEGDKTDNELEIWYDGAAKLLVTLVTPGGDRLGPVAAGKTVSINSQGARVGRIIHREQDPNTGANQIDSLLARVLPSGVWQVELSAEGAPVSFHAWIERDDYGQSRFSAPDVDPACTIGSISCGKHTIVVGSYDATVQGRDISGFSAEGPTRKGAQKPEVCAPGHGVRAARSRGQGGVKKWGTSMAAPHVAGLVALLMQAAGRPLTVAEIRDALLRGVRKYQPDGGWHSLYGNGRVDAVATILTRFPEVAAPEPANDLVPAAATNGSRAASLNDFLLSLIEGKSSSRIRLRVELEVEPQR